MAKFLDDTGLKKLISLIKAKDSELESGLSTATQTANEAKQAAEQASGQVAAIESIPDAEIQSAWEGGE